MADDQVVTQAVAEEAAAPPVESGVTSTSPEPAEAETPSIPKPRFDEVLTRAKTAEQKARELEARVQSLEARPVAQTQPTQQLPTLEQVWTMYERGQLTEAQKDQWVVYHTKEAAKQEFGQAVTQAVSLAKAQSTTAEYLKAYPTILDASSQDFRDLSTTFNELLAEGAPNSPVTQAKALRMTFGPLKAQKAVAVSEHSRQRADTFIEGSGGGGASTTPDPLREVPDRIQQHWKKMGYTKGQMAEEAKFKGVGNISDYRRLAKKKA